VSPRRVGGNVLSLTRGGVPLRRSANRFPCVGKGVGRDRARPPAAALPILTDSPAQRHILNSTASMGDREHAGDFRYMSVPPSGCHLGRSWPRFARAFSRIAHKRRNEETGFVSVPTRRFKSPGHRPTLVSSPNGGQGSPGNALGARHEDRSPCKGDLNGSRQRDRGSRTYRRIRPPFQD